MDQILFDIFESVKKVILTGGTLLVWCWFLFALAVIASAMEVKKK